MKDLVFDEVTGTWGTWTAMMRTEPAFLIVDERYAYATAPTRAEAMRTQLQLGLRARTKIIQT